MTDKLGVKLTETSRPDRSVSKLSWQANWVWIVAQLSQL